MLNQKVKARRGFTIIELVLVLAIAGLIFLMVFVALPALQSSQRDTQRREDLSRLATAITQYQANNNGELPKGPQNGEGKVNNTFVKQYLGNDFKDPSTGEEYNVIVLHEEEPLSSGYMQIYIKAKCNGDSANIESTKLGERNFAVVVKLENGRYCVDNS